MKKFLGRRPAAHAGLLAAELVGQSGLDAGRRPDLDPSRPSSRRWWPVSCPAWSPSTPSTSFDSLESLESEPPSADALARLARVVGGVEARALEVDGDRVEDPLDRRAALLARGHRVVRHRLEDLELVAVAAAVLVDRHRESIIAAASAASWHSARSETSCRDSPQAVTPDDSGRTVVVDMRSADVCYRWLAQAPGG